MNRNKSCEDSSVLVSHSSTCVHVCARVWIKQGRNYDFPCVNSFLEHCIVLYTESCLLVYVAVVSQARPFPSRSTDRFQYRHAEEGSGDLGPLHVNVWNTIIRSVTCKAHNYSRVTPTRQLLPVLFAKLLALFVRAMIDLGLEWHLRRA